MTRICIWTTIWQPKLYLKEIMDCDDNRVWFAEILMIVVAIPAYIMLLRRL